MLMIYFCLMQKNIPLGPYNIRIDSKEYEYERKNDNSIIAKVKGSSGPTATISISKNDPACLLSADVNSILKDTKRMIMAKKDMPSSLHFSIGAPLLRFVKDGREIFYACINYHGHDPKIMGSCERAFCFLDDNYMLNIYSIHPVSIAGRLAPNLANNIHIYPYPDTPTNYPLTISTKKLYFLGKPARIQWEGSLEGIAGAEHGTIELIRDGWTSGFFIDSNVDLTKGFYDWDHVGELEDSYLGSIEDVKIRILTPNLIVLGESELTNLVRLDIEVRAAPIGDEWNENWKNQSNENVIWAGGKLLINLEYDEYVERLDYLKFELMTVIPAFSSPGSSFEMGGTILNLTPSDLMQGYDPSSQTYKKEIRCNIPDDENSFPTSDTYRFDYEAGDYVLTYFMQFSSSDVDIRGIIDLDPPITLDKIRFEDLPYPESLLHSGMQVPLSVYSFSNSYGMLQFEYPDEDGVYGIITQQTNWQYNFLWTLPKVSWPIHIRVEVRGIPSADYGDICMPIWAIYDSETFSVLPAE